MRRRDLGLLSHFSRREALVGGLASIAACVPLPAETPAVEPATIDTIVVLMMENRSFDHILGSLSLEGRDVDGLAPDMQNADASGQPRVVAPATVDCLSDPPHSASASHAQFNGGANDGFVREYEARGAPEIGEVMGYYERDRLPITYALADAYTVCDAYFCSVLGPTWPNREYAHGGTSEGRDANDLPENGGAFTFPTVWTKLDEVGVAWRYYYVDMPFLGLFEGHMRDGTYDLLEDFVRDAERGKLPPVVWIDPGFLFNDDHPPHHPGLGQELIAVIYRALAASPQWSRCLFLITYDEHGGFFDHVPPPATDDDHAGFEQMGFRVPAIAIGPYVRPGTDGTVFDHTSWLKYVCERFGIEPWTRRIAAANSLGAVLDTDRMARSEAFEPVEVPAFDVDDATLPGECFNAGGPTPPPHRALREYVARHLPGLDRSDRRDEILRWIREKARS